ncbi:helix-turn-helix domain-containing protein [Enterococcus sp. BWR-S5]|uniref:helix-turn-helix domain-containing protein n=1 Tax=Enterococcus sp. BWR-S5 TaxID=2787714 RepID=UPI001921F554|nr:helix-turn-helix domain-containing protein [Enterococcus sp. BWR-S5]MBL1227326.1 helix-turn-helix domain-containing protein [Enterococcus sp. BWR-S5]
MKLFEKDDGRAYELLLVLLQEINNPDLTVAHLSKRMNTDRRIIQKYLHRLIEDNKHIHTSEKLDLHISRGGVITLSIPASFDKNAFKALYYERATSFKLMIDILMGRFVSIEDFADRNFISIPSVYRKFTYLKEQLNVLQVGLDLKSERKFIGLERQVRLFYFYLLSDVQNYLTIPDFLTIKGEKRYSNISNLWLTITYFRLRSQNYVRQVDQLDQVTTFPTKESEFHFLSAQTLGTVFDSFSLDPQTLAAEQHCLYIVFSSTMGLFSDMQTLSEVSAPYSGNQLKTTIEQLSYTWLQLFIDFFNLSVDEKSFNYMYQVMLNAHAISFIFKGKVHWIHRMDDYSLVILENSALDEKIEAFFNLLKKNSNFKIFSNLEFTVAFSLGYTFFIHSFLTLLSPPVRIHVFSKLGYLAASYLQEKIVKFSMVPVTFVENEQLADILISDTYNPFMSDKPTIHTQPLPQEHELAHIKSVVEKKYYENILKNQDLSYYSIAE